MSERTRAWYIEAIDSLTAERDELAAALEGMEAERDHWRRVCVIVTAGRDEALVELYTLKANMKGKA